MRRIMTSLILSLGLVALSTVCHADTAKFDKAMGALMAPYLKIHGTLAGDSDKGVAKAAKKIAKLSGNLNPKGVGGKHSDHYKEIPGKIRAAADKVAKGKDIAAKREAFKELSKPFAMWGFPTLQFDGKLTMFN